MDSSFNVDVFRCEEANVYVGTSEDIPGLTLESDTLADCSQPLKWFRIEQNLELPPNSEVRLRCAFGKDKGGAQRQNARSPKPRFIVEEELSLTHA